MQAAIAIWKLLRATRRRGQEQWYTADRLAQLRQPRLRKLGEAAASAPYYRDVFRDTGVLATGLTPDTLDLLPVLEKATLQERGPELLSSAAPAEGVTISTSGSTGAPLRIVRSLADQAEVSAVWARVFRSYGRKTFDRQVNIGSGQSVARKGPAAVLRKLGLLQVHQLSSFDPMDEQIRLLRRIRPQLLSAYGIGLELLAEAVVAAGVRDIRPRVVYTSGTALTPRGRALAEEAFGVRPFDVYAANEVGPIAWECPQERGVLHLNDDVQWTEILDDEDKPVPPRETGQVVVTQLLCLSQPLLRYRIGDLARLIPERCPCGRGLRLMSPVLGRSQHTIRAPDGRLLNTVVVSAILGAIPGIRRYQVRQRGPRELLISILPGDDWSPATSAVIEREFRQRLGDSFQYDVVPVDDLPLAPSGKFQTIIPLIGGDQEPR